jgi:hypothetical protein
MVNKGVVYIQSTIHKYVKIFCATGSILGSMRNAKHKRIMHPYMINVIHNLHNTDREVN